MADNRSFRNYTVICYKQGSQYKAYRNDGVLLSQSSRAEIVIKAALANKGLIYFPHEQGGIHTTWDCTSLDNPGFTLPDRTCVIGDAWNNVFITVPNGYTGDVIRIGQDLHNVGQGWRGVGILERGNNYQQNWTGIKFQMDDPLDGIQGSRFENIFMYGPKVGIELEVSDSDAWVNANIFQNIWIYTHDEAAFKFDLTGGGRIDNNIFINCVSEVAANCAFKDVDGSRNQFENCQVWDSIGTVVDMNIKASAVNTAIFGGRIGVSGTYTNLGTGTVKSPP